MSKLKYHTKSLKLIGCEPKFSGETHPELPASVAEWYSLANGVELLKQYSNVDFPLLPSEFRTYSYEDKELMVFMFDNAGIVWYAFEKADDDPPIYVNLEPPPDNWVYDSESFSTFVYIWFFDNLHHVKKDLFIRKNGKPLSKNTLEILLTVFISEPVSHVGNGPVVYRFSFDDQRISVFDYEGISSQWLFTADTQTSLTKVYEKFEHLF